MPEAAHVVAAFTQPDYAGGAFAVKDEEELEARGGIEPPNKGFADLCLTTWLPRPALEDSGNLSMLSLLRSARNDSHPRSAAEFVFHRYNLWRNARRPFDRLRRL
jgi:hypothetical protein